MRLAALLLMAIGPSVALAAPCTTTISPGANLASTISSASAGSTVCLNSGNWGSQDVGEISKSAPGVIVRSTTGQGASFGSFTLYRSSNLTFDSLTFNSGVIVSDFVSTPRSNNISFSNNAFGSSLRINVAGNIISNTITVGPGNIFSGYSSTGGIEGHIYIEENGSSGTVTLLITGNTFDGTSTCSDGVQVGGGVSNVTISRNIFQHKTQGSCGPHVDAIQQVGGSDNVVVEENFFLDNCIHIGYYDGGSNSVIRNNVFSGGGVNCGGSNNQPIQIGGFNTMLIEHNTFVDFGGAISFGTKTGQSQNTNWTVQNNVFRNTDQIAGGDQPGCGANCIMRYNLKDAQSSTSPTGSNNVSGSPTFVGGSSPSTWAGFQLANGSNGKNAGNDGQDMGTTYYGPDSEEAMPSNQRFSPALDLHARKDTP